MTIACAIGVVTALQAAAPPPPRTVRPATAIEIQEPLAHVNGVRELSDGRVIVTDGRDRRLLMADFSKGTLTQIGRTGSGPGEFLVPNVPLPSTGDSTLMFDVLSHRMHVIAGGRVVRTVPPDSSFTKAVFVGGIDVIGMDHRGDAVAIARHPIVPGRDPGQTDSSALVRIRRASGRVDTIAMLLASTTSIRARPGGRDGVASAVRTMPPFSVGEQSVVFADGWIGIVRMNPYRVDWVDPAGRRIVGRDLGVPSVRVDDREKEFYLRTHPRAPRSASSVDWPDVVPPIHSEFAVFTDPRGFLVVRRTPTSRTPEPGYDIVNRRGERVEVLRLAPRERLAGFGNRWVYTVTVDDDDLQHLARRPWPVR